MKRNDYLDVNELCIVLNKAHNTVRNMLRKGEFETSFQKGSRKKWYVTIKEIISYLKNKEDKIVTEKELRIKISKVTSNDFTKETQFMTVEDAKEILDKAYEFIYNNIKTGKLKAKKVRNGKTVPIESFHGKYMISLDSIQKLKEEI